MRKLLTIPFTICLLIITAGVNAQTSAAPTIKSTLLEQFKTTYNQQDWFVPIMKGIEGVTAKQATWKPSDSSHSIGQLVNHILFWNKQLLDKFKGTKRQAFSGNNDETFNAFTEASWTTTIRQLDQLMKDWENAINQSDGSTLQPFYKEISEMNVHNAYHTGQILYIRKLAGNWDPAKGVK